MFDVDRFSQHTLQLFTSSIETVRRGFQQRFSSFLTAAQAEAYFRVFCDGLAEAVADSVNIMTQFAQQKILTGLEGETAAGVHARFEALRAGLAGEIRAEQFDEYMAQVERQKELLSRYVQMKLHKLSVAQDNQLAAKFTGQVIETLGVISEGAVSDEQVRDDSRRLKGMENELVRAQQQIGELLRRRRE